MTNSKLEVEGGGGAKQKSRNFKIQKKEVKAWWSVLGVWGMLTLFAPFVLSFSGLLLLVFYCSFWGSFDCFVLFFSLPSASVFFLPSLIFTTLPLRGSGVDWRSCSLSFVFFLFVEMYCNLSNPLYCRVAGCRLLLGFLRVTLNLSVPKPPLPGEPHGSNRRPSEICRIMLARTLTNRPPGS